MPIYHGCQVLVLNMRHNIVVITQKHTHELELEWTIDLLSSGSEEREVFQTGSIHVILPSCKSFKIMYLFRQ